MALPYIFSSGTIIASAQVNANFAVCALTDFSNTSNTGSGANVLGVSPTLVAPALGTPVSVTLTNATGLPLTSGVSGILPVLNGGTGTASPNLTQGSGITITGTWPNQTIAATVTAYPGAGIANSTGSAWGTSYSTTGTGTVVALATSASLTTPGIGSGGALFAGSTFTVTLKASASTTGSYTFTLPVSGGATAGYVLSTDGSGTTSWVAPATGSSLVVGGSPITGGTSGYILYNTGGTLGNIQAATSSSASSVVLRDANANITSNAFYAGTTNAAAAGTTTVLTAASTPNNIVTGSGGQTFQLPSALTLPIGATFTFNNNQSSGTISVNNNSSTLVVSVPSGAFTTVSLLTNGSAAGTWDIHAAVPSNVSWSTNTLTWTGTIASGTTWNGAAIGTAYGGTGTSTAFTAGSVHFSGAAGVYSQNNAQFFWDNTNNRLGIGTASPGYLFTVSGTSSLNGILIDGNIHSIANSSAYTISGGSVYNNGGAIQFYGSTSTPAGALIFQTDPGSGSTERMRIAANGSVTVSAPSTAVNTLTVNGLSAANVSVLNVGGANTGGSETVRITDTGNPNGANVYLLGNGATTPAKFLRVVSGVVQWVNNGYASVIWQMDDAGGITQYSDALFAGSYGPTSTLSIGYRGLPQSGGTAKTVNYACVLSDAGQHIWSNSGLTVTIPANSSVAYPVGTTLTIMNAQTTGNVTIAITTDTLYLANTAGTSGSRTLAPLGVSTAIKVGATQWVISGVGLS